MRRCLTYAVALAVATGFSWQSVSAQDFSMPVIQIAPDFAMSNLNRELLDRRNAAGGQGDILAPDIGSSCVDRLMLRFSADQGRRTENMQDFVNRVRGSDPEGAAQLEEIFASADVMGMIASAMTSVGLDANNVADAYTVWWISAYQASQGSVTTPIRARYQAVRQQSENALLSSTYLINATDADKQQLAEAYLVQAALVDSSVAEMQSTPQHLDALKAAVKQGAMTSGLDLDRMVLTDDGFRSR